MNTKKETSKENLLEIDSNLKELRMQIDNIDQQLIPLLDKRASLVFKVGKWKKENGKEILDPNRELQILERIALIPRTTLSCFEIESLFKGIIEFFRNAEAAHQNIESGKKMTFLDKKGTFGFLGFGLIGASIALSLKESYPECNFLIHDPFLATNDYKDWITTQEKKSKLSFNNFKLVEFDELNNLDIVFLSAPININRKLGPFLTKKNKIVLNLGSYQEDLPDVLGFHPLAGKEVSGFKNSQSDLFYKKWIYLSSPSNRNFTELELSTLKQIAMSLGAEVFSGNNSTHNKSLSYSSHLLQLLSMIYGITLENRHEELNFHVVPKSGWEFLRLNGSDLKMWAPVFERNSENVIQALNEFEENLRLVKKIITSKTEENSESQSSSDVNPDEGNISSIRKLFIKGQKIYNHLYLRRKKDT
ncbi:MAG: prephenate dehydrogenase/arogenate dehydrogenase family protein [Bdellovibrionaceae bacterium]|nr:prephenate dehydrogenase/arogenate dehydrogenase family protein [Pseudobdellovibrionaceae bacterium]NUM59284.1 prephenate dehydrogenase/arogenate dehydrogenase family protein [Pseudobdellovibrionaceae bacterium]